MSLRVLFKLAPGNMPPCRRVPIKCDQAVSNFFRCALHALLLTLGTGVTVSSGCLVHRVSQVSSMPINGGAPCHSRGDGPSLLLWSAIVAVPTSEPLAASGRGENISKNDSGLLPSTRWLLKRCQQ